MYNQVVRISSSDIWHLSYTLNHEIIRQKKRHLTICQASFNEQADQLIGAGCVDRIIASYVWMEVFGPCSCFRRAMEKGLPHKVEMEDYTNFAMMARFLAGSLGVPYIPINSMKGSDMLKYPSWMGENKAKLLKDPFGSGFETASKGGSTMTNATMNFTLQEMMAVAAAREIKDGEKVIVGTGLPLLGAFLAQKTNAPNIIAIHESGAIDCKPIVTPFSVADSVLVPVSAMQGGLME